MTSTKNEQKNPQTNVKFQEPPPTPLPRGRRKYMAANFKKSSDTMVNLSLEVEHFFPVFFFSIKNHIKICSATMTQ